MSDTIDFFKEITKIPRPSKNEDKIREYLINWALESGFEYKTDTAWNLFVYVLSSDFAQSQPLLLQSHMDMVCVKTEDSEHDFFNDPLDIYEEEWFIKSRNTTLGADNGIWVALSMAAAWFEIKPPLELVFTVDEEQWMWWVLNLDFSLLKSKRVINLDSENENEICISSAWWARLAVAKPVTQKTPKNFQYTLSISWMKWWHSWVEIHKNQHNAIRVLLDFINSYWFQLEIWSIEWWTADNVIPSSVKMVFWTQNIDIFKDIFSKYLNEIKLIYDCPDITYDISKNEGLVPIVDDFDFILSRILNMKTWVYSMSKKIPWLVQSSVNLWIMRLDYKWLELTYLPRSSDMIEFEEILTAFEKNFTREDYIFSISSRYPWWQDDPNWELVVIAEEEMEKIIWNRPQKIAIHAWLECWAMVAWLWDWASAISIWPNMHDIHSVNERLEIDSVNKIEKALEAILERLA